MSKTCPIIQRDCINTSCAFWNELNDECAVLSIGTGLKNCTIDTNVELASPTQAALVHIANSLDSIERVTQRYSSSSR